MLALLGTKLLLLAILLLGSSIHRSDASPVIAGILKNSKDGNQVATAIEAESHDEEPLKRVRRANGCSIPYGLPFFYKTTFTSACNSHDDCYEYKEDSRLGCDDKFLQDMLDACNDTHGQWKLKACKKAANVYYNAVRHWGASYYG